MCFVSYLHLKWKFRPPILLKKWLGMVHQLLLSDFINLGIHASFEALNIIYVSVMRIPPLSGSLSFLFLQRNINDFVFTKPAVPWGTTRLEAK